MEAYLRFRYDDERAAEAVAKAVMPDNLKTPSDMSITTAQKGCEVTVQILCERGLETLLATVDDLLVCVGAVEQSIGVVREMEGRQTL